MTQISEDMFTIQGEVLEILHQKEAGFIKIVCKPDWLLLLVRDTPPLRLKDKVLLEGSFKVKEVHKIEMDPKNKNP